MIQFNKVILHNFGSYSHAEVELKGRGFCLVSGKNNFKKDNALSNGSGKSFLWSAICFALTGETINGLKNNLKNINIEENSCYTTLDFNVNSDHYEITRYIAPKSDLKISKNDIDVSGKGIRESEKKLSELLPDITKDLIASTIIIGQGMPNKFSSFSPAGRKELLEKLTKSDFMIEDIKNRVSNRSQELTKKIREFEDNIIAQNTKLSINNTNLSNKKAELSQAIKPNFDVEMEALQQTCDNIQKELEVINTKMTDMSKIIEDTNASLLVVTSEKAEVNKQELEAYNTKYNSLTQEKLQLEFKIKNLVSEINKLKSIKDTCPTCGQKLPNVEKPNTDKEEAELYNLNTELESIKNQINECIAKHKQYLLDIDTQFAEKLQELNNSLTVNKKQLNQYKDESNDLMMLLEHNKAQYNKLAYDKLNWDKYYNNLLLEIENYEKSTSEISNTILIVTAAKDNLIEHMQVIKKMDTLIKRDFRGYLLTNIINYIDHKAKDYSEIVFGTRELNIYINGNALDITYCNKMFDSLSGGEKQRVDLILQFAIRDMLSLYLNFNSNILVLDEITDFLDKQSCSSVMSLIEKELNTVESVFIISHHAETLELPIDSEIKIIKNEEGISEVF